MKTKTIEIIGYPEGNIIEVTEEQLNQLKELDLVSLDSEWTEEKPKGQWGFNNLDEDEINRFITSPGVYNLIIPKNDIIPEKGDFNMNQVVQLLRDYKNNPKAIQFIADMMEE